jgi:hypothetical protein
VWELFEYQFGVVVLYSIVMCLYTDCEYVSGYWSVIPAKYLRSIEKSL